MGTAIKHPVPDLVKPLLGLQLAATRADSIQDCLNVYLEETDVTDYIMALLFVTAIITSRRS